MRLILEAFLILFFFHLKADPVSPESTEKLKEDMKEELTKYCLSLKKTDFVYIDVITDCAVELIDGYYMATEHVKPMWCCRPGCNPTGDLFSGEKNYYLKIKSKTKAQSGLKVIANNDTPSNYLNKGQKHDGWNEKKDPYLGCTVFDKDGKTMLPAPKEHRFCIFEDKKTIIRKIKDFFLFKKKCD